MTKPLTAAALSLLCGTALAASPTDYPPRKPGLWEMTLQTGASGGKAPAGHVTQQCIDAASDKAMREMGMGVGEKMCSKQEMRAEGGGFVVDSVCRIDLGNGTASTATTHGVITGDFGSAYRMVMRSTYDPPMMGRAQGETIMEAKWVGPCKAGQKPGDMVMPGGQTMNVLEMMKNRPKK
ncbi:DUF3617 family protein [Variovorax robiniae]|uniref:DUF3617 family protein n=1 Tax=Variovorax robiniae TaxID=1836199 RepID=A0ABU8XIU6_9BURK